MNWPTGHLLVGMPLAIERHSYCTLTPALILQPKVTFFGNARSEHLAYGAWSSRNLPLITNNQAGLIIAKTTTEYIDLYVTHKPFAEAVDPGTFHDDDLHAYHLATIS